MNYRYQEILTWIIPGFFLLVAIGFIWCISNETLPFFSFNTSTYKDAQLDGINKFLYECLLPKSSTSFWNAVATVLVFLIPMMSLLVGWIVNAFGGLIMKIHIIRRFFLLLVMGCPKSEKEYSLDIVEKYSKCIKSHDPKNLEQLDRFYYRYVFSRNMLAAQTALIVISAFILHSHNYQYDCRIIMLEFVMAFIFLVIMIRDFHTHVSFVFSWKK